MRHASKPGGYPIDGAAVLGYGAMDRRAGRDGVHDVIVGRLDAVKNRLVARQFDLCLEPCDTHDLFDREGVATNNNFVGVLVRIKAFGSVLWEVSFHGVLPRVVRTIFAHSIEKVKISGRKLTPSTALSLMRARGNQRKPLSGVGPLLAKTMAKHLKTRSAYGTMLTFLQVTLMKQNRPEAVADLMNASSAEAPIHGIASEAFVWDKETDVLVVGSGYAGLSAAIEAHDAGASVIILEKM